MDLFDDFLQLAFKEDLREGDVTSLSTIPEEAIVNAKIVAKETGILAGIEVAKKIFHFRDSTLQIDNLKNDGDSMQIGDVILRIKGKARSILEAERIVLNSMQRMSGIATKTKHFVDLISSTDCKLLDTRKTTPGIRILEKEAVKIGGGYNHRMGLYDMIMIKDNHVDFAGGIKPAIEKANNFRQKNNPNLKIEIEVRSIAELNQVLSISNVDRVMLDNFTPGEISEALKLIDGKFETEASGGINENTILSYAQTGVDYISVGALTHSVNNLDLSLISE